MMLPQTSHDVDHFADHAAGNYVGRFAPSPSGPLHAGSLVAAMASYLDARAHGGRWLVRIEDVDEPRSVPGAAEGILSTLAALQMHWDGPVLVQSQRRALYAAAFARLTGFTYPCACSRREIADSSAGIGADGSAVYPGTCRHGLAHGKTARAQRLRVPDAGPDPESAAPESALDAIHFIDRWQGAHFERLAESVGDFVLLRADGYWAYQLAVVVDDAAQGVTHVVRGVDLLDSTARQIYLQGLLGYATPHYLHVPVLCNAAGEKLSKQTGALALDLDQPLPTVLAAAAFLGLDLGQVPVNSLDTFWELAISAWARRLATLRPAVCPV